MTMLLRPPSRPAKRTAWPPGAGTAESKLLREDTDVLPDYPALFLLEDNNSILLEG